MPVEVYAHLSTGLPTLDVNIGGQHCPGLPCGELTLMRGAEWCLEIFSRHVARHIHAMGKQVLWIDEPLVGEPFDFSIPRDIVGALRTIGHNSKGYDLVVLPNLQLFGKDSEASRLHRNKMVSEWLPANRPTLGKAAMLVTWDSFTESHGPKALRYYARVTLGIEGEGNGATIKTLKSNLDAVQGSACHFELDVHRIVGYDPPPVPGVYPTRFERILSFFDD
jgi:hypothetical protein